MARQIRSDQEFRDKVLKLMPSEIVAAFMVLNGLAAGPIVVADKEVSGLVSWVVFGVLLVLTPVYLVKIHRVTYLPQVILTTLTFPVWVYSLGGPFAPWQQPQLAAIALVLWTLLIPLFVRPEGRPEPQRA